MESSGGSAVRAAADLLLVILARVEAGELTAPKRVSAWFEEGQGSITTAGGVLDERLGCVRPVLPTQRRHSE